MTAPSTLRRRTVPADPPFVRLVSCPRCSGRRRVLDEIDGDVRGRCLECGAELPVPLATERHQPHLVGHAGRATVTLEVED
jgi:DNA-directed RNA polymerase subunit RPC12/RpoP